MAKTDIVGITLWLSGKKRALIMKRLEEIRAMQDRLDQGECKEYEINPDMEDSDVQTWTESDFPWLVNVVEVLIGTNKKWKSNG